MTELDPKLEARLLALEHLTCQVYSMALGALQLSEQEITGLEYRGVLSMDRQASEISARGSSGRAADEFVSAFQDALASLQTQAREMREAIRAQRHS